MALASSLDEGTDHVGVYCTSGTDLADTCLLSIARPLNRNLLREKLDEVPHRPRDSFRVEDAFLQAAQALRTLRLQSRRDAPRVKEDIVIVTSSAVGLTSCFQQDLSGLRVHVVNPSLVPYSREACHELSTRNSTQLLSPEAEYLGQKPTALSAKAHHGWLLDSSRCVDDDCHQHKTHSLVDAILQSKFQAYGGSINDVSIAIREGTDVCIEEVIGDMTFATISPGQIISIPIRVKLDSFATKIPISSSPGFCTPSRMSMADAISKLELSLGTHLSELFEIQITYSHSFFPGNTRLTIRECCWLPRSMETQAAKQRCDDVFQGSSRLTRNPLVQRQLVLCIAASYPPAEALRKLGDLNTGMLSDGLNNFIDALKRRLKHRVALLADVSFMDYMLALDYVEQSSRVQSGGEAYEIWLDEFVSSHVYDGTDGPDTPTTIVQSRSEAAQILGESDESEARRIWQHIRRTSSLGEPSDMTENYDLIARKSLQEQELNIEQIRKTAHMHGRKISSATLRSLAKDFRRRSPSFVEAEDELEGEFD